MRWIGIINLALVGMILFVAIFFVFNKQEDEYPLLIARPEQKELPKNPFSVAEECFQEIGEKSFILKWVPPQMHLPDLRQELLFYGKNARPDSVPGKASFHFTLKGSAESTLVRENERTYLVYQGSNFPKILAQDLKSEKIYDSCSPLWGDISATHDIPNDKPAYIFSPGNQATPLWFEVKNGSDQSVEVRVSMLDEKGALVSSPAEWRIFHLQAQDVPKSQLIGWDLGGYRADTSLLVRQKARWVGQDVFLALHGGEEFTQAIGKERIDFLDGPCPYSCFVGVNDFLVWKDKRWTVVTDHDQTQRLPLLVVKKIDEKIISFELWDPEGRGKISLSLIRTKDQIGIPSLSQEFRFVGAKTWAQFIVECRTGGRMTLKPHDWLVLTQDGWIKLDSPDQIDAFVNQSVTGPLFILDKMTKKNGKQILIGHLFNALRTEVEQVELTSAPTAPLVNFYRHMPTVPPIQPKTQIIEGSEE